MIAVLYIAFILWVNRISPSSQPFKYLDSSEIHYNLMSTKKKPQSNQDTSDQPKVAPKKTSTLQKETSIPQSTGKKESPIQKETPNSGIKQHSTDSGYDATNSQTSPLKKNLTTPRDKIMNSDTIESPKAPRRLREAKAESKVEPKLSVSKDKCEEVKRQVKGSKEPKPKGETIKSNVIEIAKSKLIDKRVKESTSEKEPESSDKSGEASGKASPKRSYPRERKVKKVVRNSDQDDYESDESDQKAKRAVKSGERKSRRLIEKEQDHEIEQEEDKDEAPKKVYKPPKSKKITKSEENMTPSQQEAKQKRAPPQKRRRQNSSDIDRDSDQDYNSTVEKNLSDGTSTSGSECGSERDTEQGAQEQGGDHQPKVKKSKTTQNKRVKVSPIQHKVMIKYHPEGASSASKGSFPISSTGTASSFAKKRPTLKDSSGPTTSTFVKVRIINRGDDKKTEAEKEPLKEKTDLEKNWDKFQEFNPADDEGGAESSSAKDTGTSAKVTPEKQQQQAS